MALRLHGTGEGLPPLSFEMSIPLPRGHSSKLTRASSWSSEFIMVRFPKALQKLFTGSEMVANSLF